MNEYNEWASPQDDVSIKGLKSLHEELLSVRDNKESIEKQLSDVNEKKAILENKILMVMKEAGIPSFKSDLGTISIKNNKSVAQPETMEEKLKFFDYLREQGVFDSMVSVNSRTLTSWASKEIEGRESKGIFGWVPPGLKPANDYQTLSVRKK